MGIYLNWTIEEAQILFDHWYEGYFKELITKGDIVEVKTPHGRIVDIDKVLEFLSGKGDITCGEVVKECLVIEAEVE